MVGCFNIYLYVLRSTAHFTITVTWSLTISDCSNNVLRLCDNRNIELHWYSVN